ncbi:MAG: hypothetical protein D6702_02720 [Planctomycetota bacterium]|nr:MAG: hypothetical protein D6702_02720 [Planctomycetota bacterium]
MLSYSLSHPILGRLSAEGRSSFPFRLPPSGALSGQLVYARALVPDPAHPRDLWTQSSLEEIQVL